VRHHFEGGRYVPTSKAVYFDLKFMSIYDAFRDLNGALFAHPVLAYLSAEMHNPTRTRLSAMTWIAMIVTGIACYAIPLIGYLVDSEVEPDAMYFYWFNAENSPEVVAGIVCVLIVSLTSNLLFTFLTGQLFLSLWTKESIAAGQKHLPSHVVRGITAACAGMLAICINFTNEYVTIIWYDVATFGYSFLGFFLPGVLYVRQYGLAIVGWGILSCLIIAIGGVLMVMTIVGMVQGLMELKE
jgi:branched-subunit amino acid transport protein